MEENVSMRLLGKDSFDYFGHLVSEMEKRQNDSTEESFQHIIHSHFKDIILSEDKFFRYLESNGEQPVLLLAANGLPSADFLNSNLERMCHLMGGEDSSLPDFIQKYNKNNFDKVAKEKLYKSVSEDEWGKELEKRKDEKLERKISFKFDTLDDKLEFLYREEVYVIGYDQHSKDFPVMIREGSMRYGLIFNQLVFNNGNNFYIPDTAALSGEKIITTDIVKRKFDNIQNCYEFPRSAFNGVPLFSKFRYNKIKDYAKFLASGTDARVKFTKDILGILSHSFDVEIKFKDINTSDLSELLAFSNIPFKNASKSIPYYQELFKGDVYSWVHDYADPKVPINFDLIHAYTNDRVGKILYALPHLVPHGNSFQPYHRFNLGWIDLKIFGSAIQNEDQNKNLRYVLARLK